MKVVERNVELLSNQPYEEMLRVTERGIRVCYKSEDKIKDGSAEDMVRMMININHGGCLEHVGVSFLVTCDRATSHQLERSRTLSYNEMSQRYCNFSKDKFDSEVKFIKPCDLADGYNTDIWQEANEIAEGAYFNLLASKCKPEVARSVLPNSTATEVVVTGNMRNIRYFLSLRLDEHAQSDIREIAHKMLNILHEKYPVFVEDLWEKYGD